MDSLMVAIMLSTHPIPAPVVRNVEIIKPEIIAPIPTRDVVASRSANIWNLEDGTDEQ